MLHGPATGRQQHLVVRSEREQRFVTVNASDEREWIERPFNPEVRVRGTLATVWAEYDFHFASTPSHCGVDALQLIETSAGWRIVSIADTFETTGCPTRPAPAAGR